MSAAANPIVQIETLGVLAAFSAWHHLLINRPVIVFVDKDASRACLVTGSAREEVYAKLVQEICSLEIRARTLAWFERVPSSSNLADDPSRGVRPAALSGWPSATLSCGWAPALGCWGVREQCL